MLSWPTKSPGEVRDYAINWTVPDGDSIKTSAWEIPNGLTKERDTLSGSTCTVWLSGGKLNDRFTIINRVETVCGRVGEQYVRLVIGVK